MKTIRNYFKKRKEEKLRKWCVEQVAKADVPKNEFLGTVEWLYTWVKKGTI